jgi:hypothetical protein
MGRVRVGALMLVLAGCGGGSLGSPDGSTPSEFATTPGSSVLTPAALKVTLMTKSGGFGTAGAPTGSACSPGYWSYKLSLDTKRLAFDGCRVQGDPSLPASYVPAMDDLALSDADLATLTFAAAAVTVSARRECGADRGARELRVESADAALTYGDDFWGCLEDYDSYVDWQDLDNLQALLQGIDQ